ncbi:HepT-like ribonuclease domain-containing protein [Rhizobium sp. 18065]|uniref:HepT-like ribonuclease domain-containing protein n=1 Tax=Rhizobium sp. 18065 TaxID=2681411 RepID=UPI001359EFA9|nr:HepT-like ribonuclease domain-containing protein [Rhizobium sp. 18065]
MSEIDRLLDYLNRMQSAATQAIDFTKDLQPAAFERDTKTQMAVAMAFVLIGEAATRISSRFPEFVADHPEIAWAKIRGMRNLIAHDYNELDMPVVWRTLKNELPVLVDLISQLRSRHMQGE